MADIRAFRGVLYNPQKLSISRIVAPPYDIIAAREQDRLYRLHPLNSIRLIFGKVYSSDNKNNNRYTRAREFYKKLFGGKILVLDRAPSIYVYRIDFNENKKKKTRLGFIALISLKGADNRLLPHERTFSGPRKDRLKLLRSCRANFSQIFTLYSDPRKKITPLLASFMKKAPLRKARYNGETHFIWRVSDGETLEKIRKIMRRKKIFIADGHHRYETALSFKRERGSPGSCFAMLYFSNMDEDGLSILPSHRLVREGAFQESRIKLLPEFFDVISYPYSGRTSLRKAVAKANEVLRKKRQSFGLLARGEKALKVFVLKDRAFVRRFVKGRFSRQKKDLAVTLLDEGVLKGVLKVKDYEKYVSYTRDVEEARKNMEKGNFPHLFLLSPVNLKELKGIAGKGERMPHKSTYFYPKLLSGLVIYDQERSLKGDGLW